MLSQLEFVIVLIVAILFLKPKDIIAIISFIKDCTTKLKHFMYLGKEELNKIIEETKIQELKKSTQNIINTNYIKESENFIESTKNDINEEISNLNKAINLELDNIIKNNDKSNSAENNSTTKN